MGAVVRFGRTKQLNLRLYIVVKPLLELRRLLFEPFGEAVSYLVNLGVGELYSLAVAHLDVVAMLVPPMDFIMSGQVLCRACFRRCIPS